MGVRNSETMRSERKILLVKTIKTNSDAVRIGFITDIPNGKWLICCTLYNYHFSQRIQRRLREISLQHSISTTCNVILIEIMFRKVTAHPAFDYIALCAILSAWTLSDFYNDSTCSNAWIIFTFRVNLIDLSFEYFHASFVPLMT